MSINFSQGLSKRVVSTNVLYLTPCPQEALITFADRLDPNQNVGPDLDPNLFDTQMVLKKNGIRRVKYGTIIKCEGIIKINKSNI